MIDPSPRFGRLKETLNRLRSTAEHKTETHTVERLHLLAVLADASDEVGILIRYHIWTRGTRVPKEENSLRAFVIFCE